MATTTTLGRPEQPIVSYAAHHRQPSRPISSEPREFYPAAAASTSRVTMDAEPRGDGHDKQSQDAGSSRGVKRNSDALNSGEAAKRRDEYRSGYSASASAYARETHKGSSSTPSSSSPSSFAATPSMRTQLPPLNSLSPVGVSAGNGNMSTTIPTTGGLRATTGMTQPLFQGAVSDHPAMKKTKGSYINVDATASRSLSNVHSPLRTLNTIALGTDETHHPYSGYGLQQSLPPRGSSLIPRSRTNEHHSPRLAYDASPPSYRNPEPSPTSNRSLPYLEHYHHQQPQHPPALMPQYRDRQQHQRYGVAQTLAEEETAATSHPHDSSSMPLSMRRGDAAHAKASKLHIDVPSTISSSEGGRHNHSGWATTVLSYPPVSLSHQPHSGVDGGDDGRKTHSRSAPATRAAFAEGAAEGLGGDGALESEQRREFSRITPDQSSSGQQQYSRQPQQQTTHYSPKEREYSPQSLSGASDHLSNSGNYDGIAAAGGAGNRRSPVSSRARPRSVPRSPPVDDKGPAPAPAHPDLDPNQHTSYAKQGQIATAEPIANAGSVIHPLRGIGAAPPLPLPLAATPISYRFVPQTATFPSPAYHSTRLGGGPSPQEAQHYLNKPLHLAGRTSAAQGGVDIGLGVMSGAAAAATTPSLSSSSPTTTALVASKTQFLSLFSSFYDSLTDSKTLKVTLEDQVRRSNALIQTLQKSTKVLEATVEKKLKEERGLWEGRVQRLEEELRDIKTLLSFSSGGQGRLNEEQAMDGPESRTMVGNEEQQQRGRKGDDDDEGVAVPALSASPKKKEQEGKNAAAAAAALPLKDDHHETGGVARTT